MNLLEKQKLNDNLQKQKEKELRRSLGNLELEKMLQKKEVNFLFNFFSKKRKS